MQLERPDLSRAHWLKDDLVEISTLNLGEITADQIPIVEVPAYANNGLYKKVSALTNVISYLRDIRHQSMSQQIIAKDALYRFIKDDFDSALTKILTTGIDRDRSSIPWDDQISTVFLPQQYFHAFNQNQLQVNIDVFSQDHQGLLVINPSRVLAYPNTNFVYILGGRYFEALPSDNVVLVVRFCR